MTQSTSKVFSILESSILSKPRMMGTPAEKETTRFIMDFLTKAGLSPYTEEIQWSNAYVIARKVLILLFIPWLVVFNISIRVEGLIGGILSVIMPLLAVLFLVLAGKAVTNDKFSYVGRMSAGKNVICVIPPGLNLHPEKTIYFTAHTDSIGSSLPGLNMPLTIGSLLFFLISIFDTLAGGIVLLVNSSVGGSGVSPTLFPSDLLITSAINIILIILSLFARRVDTSPGAIDNGSGTAILLSLAEYFAENPLKTTTLRYIFCAAEEWGLYGSKGYVKKHKDELTSGIARDVLINVDMVGSELAYVDKAGLMIKKPLNQNLNNLINEVAEENGIQVRSYNTPFAGNSDHAPFRKLKMETAFFLSKKDTKKIHKPLDVIEGVDPQRLEDAVGLLKAVVIELDQN